MAILSLATIVATLAVAASARKCQNITVPVEISARNGVFNKAALTPQNNIDVTNFILNLTRQGHNFTMESLQGYATVSGTYKLATTYCQPDHGSDQTVQLLTHGIGFDRSYWDLSFNNYNYSFGSQHSYLLTAMYPKDSDGIFLTGFSQNGSFVPFFELGGNFVDATTVPGSTYTKGYLAAGDPSGVQTNFFSPGMFDPAILQLAFSTGQPVTVGELLTIGGETAVPNTAAIPVLIVTGERDIPYCGGDCLRTGNPALASIPAASAKNLPNAKNLQVFIVPKAGHGLNLEYSHPLTYGTILNYLTHNGLAAGKGSRSCGVKSTTPGQYGPPKYGGSGKRHGN